MGLHRNFKIGGAQISINVYNKKDMVNINFKTTEV